VQGKRVLQAHQLYPPVQEVKTKSKKKKEEVIPEIKVQPYGIIEVFQIEEDERVTLLYSLEKFDMVEGLFGGCLLCVGLQEGAKALWEPKMSSGSTLEESKERAIPQKGKPLPSEEELQEIRNLGKLYAVADSVSVKRRNYTFLSWKDFSKMGPTFPKPNDIFWCPESNFAILCYPRYFLIYQVRENFDFIKRVDHEIQHGYWLGQAFFYVTDVDIHLILPVLVEKSYPITIASLQPDLMEEYNIDRNVQISDLEFKSDQMTPPLQKRPIGHLKIITIYESKLIVMDSHYQLHDIDLSYKILQFCLNLAVHNTDDALDLLSQLHPNVHDEISIILESFSLNSEALSLDGLTVGRRLELLIVNCDSIELSIFSDFIGKSLESHKFVVEMLALALADKENYDNLNVVYSSVYDNGCYDLAQYVAFLLKDNDKIVDSLLKGQEYALALMFARKQGLDGRVIDGIVQKYKEYFKKVQSTAFYD